MSEGGLPAIVMSFLSEIKDHVIKYKKKVIFSLANTNGSTVSYYLHDRFFFSEKMHFSKALYILIYMFLFFFYIYMLCYQFLKHSSLKKSFYLKKFIKNQEKLVCKLKNQC